MKTLLKNLVACCIVTIISNGIHAQSNHPIYAHGDTELMPTATIPGYTEASQKLKISGTVYKNDGKTPAGDVIIFVYQTNEDGEFEVRGNNKYDRYIYHRTWIKTDENGKYTLYTFVPGTNYGSNEMKHIHTVIKQPNMPEYEIEGFLFEDDPYLTKYCRKRLKKAGANNILKPTKQDDILVANRDIVLNDSQMAIR